MWQLSEVTTPLSNSSVKMELILTFKIRYRIAIVYLHSPCPLIIHYNTTAVILNQISSLMHQGS